MERHFTATTYVLDGKGNALLLFHPKLRTWLPPGGHLDSGEIPHEAAKREVMEETGVDIEFIDETPIHFKTPNAYSCPRPFHVLVESIPQHKDTAAHQHVDLIFVAKAKTCEIVNNENLTICWMNLEQIDSLPKEQFFEETIGTLRYLLKPETAIV